MFFMTATLLAFISQIQVLIVAGVALCAIYAYCARANHYFQKKDFNLLLLCSLLFFPAFTKYYFGLSPVFYFISTVSTFFAAMAVSNKPPAVLVRAFEWIYWMAITGIAWVLYTYWGYPEPFGMVIEGSSTNGIPAYLIVVQLSFSLVHYLALGRLPVMSTIFTFIVAFFGNGRASLVVSALIIVATLTMNVTLTRGPQKKWRWVFLFLLILTVIISSIWGEELFDLLTRYTKLSVGLVDANRLEIWNQYSSKIDGFSLIFGADYSSTIIESEHNGNPHISYIRTHAFFGLPVTIIVMLSPLFVLFFRKAWAPKIVFCVFISLGALRATSEPIFFPTLLDLFYFTWFLILIKHAK